MMKFLKKDVFYWLLPLAVFGVIRATGTQAEVSGRLGQVVLASGFKQPDLEVLKPEKPAEELELVSLDGKKARLSDFRGKVVFMNFWATWCGPCIAEMPGIQNLYNDVALKDKDVVFLMIAVSDSKEKVKRFMEKKKFTFPVYVLEKDELPPAFDTNAIPTTFLITPGGKIAKRIEGMAEYDNAKFKEFLVGLKKKS
jgi:thiol-disulfide isomerase/thioredoxin